MWKFLKSKKYKEFECVTWDADGSVKFEVGRKYPDGMILIPKIVGWCEGHADGTTTCCYLKKWKAL